MATVDPADLAHRYFAAWRAKDPDGFRSILTEDVTFIGPLGTADGVDDYIESLLRLAEMTTEIVVHETFVDGNDVVSWFDLHTTAALLSPVANWSRVRDGKIAQVRVTFDPRPLTNPPSS